MKLRQDLLAELTMEGLAEETEKATHRLKPEPLFSRTEAGSLSPASMEERVQEAAHGTALTVKLTQSAQRTGKRRAAGK